MRTAVAWRLAAGDRCSPAAGAARSTCWRRWRSCWSSAGCCVSTAADAALVPGRCAGTSASSPVCRRSCSGRLRPASAASFHLRVAVLVLLSLVAGRCPTSSTTCCGSRTVLDLTFAGRHLVNPFRTLANWPRRRSVRLVLAPLVMGVIGLLAYVGADPHGHARDGRSRPVDPDESEAAAGEPGSANALY